ncbi:FeoB-associated Cys-rich membrane protein [Sporanaerobium hydrogeniformans]|uniref:FeoB-associated Cys-rich membrane protein n=1 Tax=Sporanaerobium hydrogeniformans TaxID=3072179 RepID=A0AC61DCE4_9FIRM|nr:FeoB-associated Cys-rich membrane protein [Sporanaerobium hydrogeniformans]PHV70979.1 FeoB-associated Cys-rich membrane protein [Sporanaerobium hydrogeniformans]
MGTFIVGSILLILVGSIIKSLIKDKKQGKSIQCGDACKNCSGHCHVK